jgi:hypothetical protein
MERVQLRTGGEENGKDLPKKKARISTKTKKPEEKKTPMKSKKMVKVTAEKRIKIR